MSHSFDPEQVRHFVGPDLGQNCLEGHQQTTKFSEKKGTIPCGPEINRDFIR